MFEECNFFILYVYMWKHEMKNTKSEKFRLKFYSASLILTIIFNIININN